MPEAGDPFDAPFGAIPESDPFEQGIYEIGDRTIKRVLGIGVMEGMMPRGDRKSVV